MNESKNQSEKPRIDYDGQWKRLILVFFEEFIDFFMPELLLDIDLSQSPEFLEQELATIMSEQTAKGRMAVDKLLKIPMKNGEYEHIFLHIEVQSQRKIDFLKKTFKYFYRIFDSKGKAVTAFVIYTHDDVPVPHDRYEYRFRGTRLVYEFNSYLVRDADEEELLKSDNIFALVILTCKYLNRTKNDVDLRRKFKSKLFRLALERGYSKQHIKTLINFINIVMYLPAEIKEEFDKEIIQEIKQINMIEDQYIVLDMEEARELRDAAIWRDEVKEQRKTVEEQRKTVEEQRKVAEEQRKAAEEQRKAAEEQRKLSINKLIKSGLHSHDEIADIMGVSVEEVLEIKAEVDAQN